MLNVVNTDWNAIRANLCESKLNKGKNQLEEFINEKEVEKNEILLENASKIIELITEVSQYESPSPPTFQNSNENQENSEEEEIAANRKELYEKKMNICD